MGPSWKVVVSSPTTLPEDPWIFYHLPKVATWVNYQTIQIGNNRTRGYFMEEWPRISVIIATRNRARYLSRCLENLFQTDYPNLEVIIMDGASTDQTIDIIHSYEHFLSFWVSEKDQGEYDAYNKGLIKSTGSILKFMSDDDVLYPNSFYKVASYFAENPDVDVVFGQQRVFLSTDQGDILGTDKPILDPSSLTLRNWIRRQKLVPSNIASFIRRTAMEKIGPFSLEYWPGDVEFWSRAAYLHVNMSILPDYFVDYYVTGENGIITRSRECRTILFKVARLYGHPNDMLYVVFFKIIPGEIVELTRSLSHLVGFHPRRWLVNRKVKQSTLN
jgi:glycosyltransferase involved in cell wall biosynthesis